MTLDELKNLKAWVAKETALDEDNVMAMTLKLPNAQNRLLNKYSQEKQILNEMKNNLNVIYKDVYIQVRFHSDYKLTTKTDLDIFTSAEESYHKAKMACDNQEVAVEYIQKALDGMVKMGYSIKAYIELLKIKNGIVS